MLSAEKILGKPLKQIQVMDRKTKKPFEEKIYGAEMMRLVYGSAWRAQLTGKILTHKFFSKVYGAYNDSSLSRQQIPAFVESMNIDMSECEKSIDEFTSFNDFFARHLRPEARPIDTGSRSIISPSDGRILVLPKITEDTLAYVKWAPLRLEDLFDGDEKLVETYRNGACAILRLCPTDYHRFHFPFEGTAQLTQSVPGLLHSVHPHCLEQKIPVYAMNKRTLCTLETSTTVKDILMMEVGAMFVGSIVQTYRPRTVVQKGAEKGFFKFGGSTCLLFFAPGTVSFDRDLVENSEQGLETYVKLGEKIALAARTN